jgi:hypothetical protein
MNISVLYLQASLEVSVEEPAATEEAKSSEVEKKADEDEEKKTDEKKEEAAEENDVVPMDTTILNEIKKEESTNSKLNCHNNVCQVPFKIRMKACIFFLFLNVQK